jgi:hypothetical protein
MSFLKKEILETDEGLSPVGMSREKGRATLLKFLVEMSERARSLGLSAAIVAGVIELDGSMQTIEAVGVVGTGRSKAVAAQVAGSECVRLMAEARARADSAGQSIN